MRAPSFDEIEFFRAVATSGARAVLIGRRALVLLGLPVLTADYDLWLAREDVERLNAAGESFDLIATRTPDEARRLGRYVLENDERVDVLLAASVTTVDGQRCAFEDVWSRRREIALAPDVRVAIPSIDDLIATKRFAARPKDVEDIRLLEVLRDGGEA